MDSESDFKDSDMDLDDPEPLALEVAENNDSPGGGRKLCHIASNETLHLAQVLCRYWNHLSK